MPIIRTTSLSSVYSDRKEKRVSFEDLTDPVLYKTEKVDPKEHKIKIEQLFPERPYRPILRRSLPDLDHLRHTQTKSRPSKKPTYKVEPIVRPRRLPPFKKPTEPLAQALLRTMSYREPSKQTRLPPINLVVKPEPDPGSVREAVSPRRVRTRRGWRSPSSQTSHTSKAVSTKTQKSASDSITFNTNVYDIVLKCGTCLRRKRTSPAAGFCRYCDEYLCAPCVYQHRGLLTRSHPVMIFNCDTCKQMDVLNKHDSGFCVRCMKYYCPRCVISHCVETNHDVLEGHDLLDVVYATIHRGFI